jgi:hypothetical protein
MCVGCRKDRLKSFRDPDAKNYMGGSAATEQTLVARTVEDRGRQWNAEKPYRS